MWRSLNSNLSTFELRTFSPDSKFNECFKRYVVECEFLEKSLFYDWFHMHREPERTDKHNFFSNSTYHTNYTLKLQHKLCSVMCYTVLIWTLIVLTLGNNIWLQSFRPILHLPKRVHCILTDKINASIRIPRILKVEIRIRRMRILTSFVTS